MTNQIDLFGGPIFAEDSGFLLDLERRSDEVSFVILSDLWLDQPSVFDKLDCLFKGSCF